jgi:hypothetical protein
MDYAADYITLNGSDNRKNERELDARVDGDTK